MPHSKGQLANTYLIDHATGFVCLETGQQRMFGDTKAYKKGIKLHFRVCETCRNAGMDDKPNYIEDKEVMKEMIKSNKFALKSTSDGGHY